MGTHWEQERCILFRQLEFGKHTNRHAHPIYSLVQMTAVGFEPTQLALVELESTPLDHSGKLSWQWWPVFLLSNTGPTSNERREMRDEVRRERQARREIEGRRKGERAQMREGERELVERSAGF